MKGIGRALRVEGVKEPRGAQASSNRQANRNRREILLREHQVQRMPGPGGEPTLASLARLLARQAAAEFMAAVTTPELLQGYPS